MKRLETDIRVLEEELQQSYELIDQLEFEIEEVSVKRKRKKSKQLILLLLSQPQKITVKSTIRIQ